MGLIKVALNSVGGVLADQWKEYILCDNMDANTLAVRGYKRISGRSGNTKGSDNVISNGSVIAVGEGQCALIVEDGKIVDFSAEAGAFTYNASSEPSLFTGDLGDSIMGTLNSVIRRIGFGGDEGKTQRVYYVNTKEIMGNKFGTVSPIPYRVVDRNIGLDMDITVKCHGEYSYRIWNPAVFFVNVCGSVADRFTRDRIDSQLKAELLAALQPALAKISEMGIRYSALPGHATEIGEALKTELTKKWHDERGIEIQNFGVASLRTDEANEKLIRDLQSLRNPANAAAATIAAQNEAMRTAAGNSAGAMTGFMGMGMVQNVGGASAAQLYQMGAQSAATPPAPDPKAWKCACGATSTGKFCAECGAPKPAEGWVCTCGAVNKGKFCTECGAKKPEGAPLYRCDKCGWEPEDPKHPPKFCPNCGDPFDENDKK